VALVDGARVDWSELQPILTDRAGALSLEEIVLDRALHRALAGAGLAVTQEAVEQERRLLLESLDDDPDVAQRLLDELRRRQGLGPHRFPALLWRNAALRLLVRDEVIVTGEAVRRTHQLLHGPRRQARLIVVPSLTEARDAARAVAGGATFAEVAVARSTDASAGRGGLLEPIGRQDPRYPEGMRTTLWSLRLGEISDPVMLNSQYALLRLESEIPGDGVALDDVRPQMERLARLQLERAAMDGKARSLLAETDVVIFDPPLRNGWEQRLNR
jgi:hypothetical protein